MIRNNYITKPKEFKCKRCGKPIILVERKWRMMTPVDTDIAYILPDEDGKMYYRMSDGSKVKGREVRFGTEGAEATMRPHGYSCGGAER